MSPRFRLRSLDGLRGLAAVIVLVHHALLVIPALAAPYYGQTVQPGLPWLLVHTPLHLLWAGTEAVYLFFILSGLVLTLAARSASFTWTSYFPSRIVRLYVPVIAAVLLAAVVIAVFPRTSDTQSAWLLARPTAYPVRSMLTDIVLIDGVSRSVSPLWSLTWEVLFSLLLPVYIVVARRLPVLLQIVIAIAASTVGFMFTIGALQYLPMFAIGVALASGWQRIDTAARRLTGVWGALAWTAVIVVASLMTISYWLLLPITGGQTRMIALPTSLVGITMLIVAAVHAPLLRAILSTRVLVFLGTISFSLYLVHEPIVIAIGNMVPHASLTLVLAAPISLAVAVAFYYAIERPAHRLAQRVRRAADRDESAFAENGLVVSGPEARVEADAPRRSAP